MKTEQEMSKTCETKPKEDTSQHITKWIELTGQQIRPPKMKETKESISREMDINYIRCWSKTLRRYHKRPGQKPHVIFSITVVIETILLAVGLHMLGISTSAFGTLLNLCCVLLFGITFVLFDESTESHRESLERAVLSKTKNLGKIKALGHTDDINTFSIDEDSIVGIKRGDDIVRLSRGRDIIYSNPRYIRIGDSFYYRDMKNASDGIASIDCEVFVIELKKEK